MAFVRVGHTKIRVPGSPLVRQTLGVGLLIGGVLGFLPVLGFWMIPLGFGVLSVDNPSVRRSRRKMEVWWGRSKQARQEDRDKAADQARM